MMQQWRRAVALAVMGFLLRAVSTADAFEAPNLSAAQQSSLKANFALCLSKLKGPYTENFCLCRDGQKLGVQAPNGAVRVPCANPVFELVVRASTAKLRRGPTRT